MSNDNEWYYQFMGEEIGPLAEAQMLEAVAKGIINADTCVRRGTTGRWWLASDVKGLLEKAKELAELQARQEERRREDAIALNNADRARWDNFTVSTSGPSPERQFEILGTVFAFDSDGEAGIFFGKQGDPGAAFARVTEGLRREGYQLGGDAVIACQFEYRVSVAGDGAAAQQAVEIFAYGTAICYQGRSLTTEPDQLMSPADTN